MSDNDNETETVSERRREMASGQVKLTPLGEVRFSLKVNLPAVMDDETFKKLMGEYAAILGKTFPYQGGLREK